MRKFLYFLIFIFAFTGCNKTIPITQKTLDYGDNSTVYIPNVSLPNSNLSNDINSQIETRIKDNYAKIKNGRNGFTMEGFSAFENGDILSIFHEGFFEEENAIMGESYLLTMHINIKNGKFYALDDLFLKDVDYRNELKSMADTLLSSQLQEYYLAYSLDLENTSFDVYDNNLIFIFNPETVAGADMGFVDVTIPFSQIDHLLDKNGEFYKVLQNKKEWKQFAFTL